MNEELTAKTLQQIKDATDIQKAQTVQTSTGLVAYRLDGPAKNLYPVYTPIRNRLPREQDGMGTAANFKLVTAINNANGFAANPFIPEGQRAAAMGITAVSKAVIYRTIGVEASITFEAQSAAAGFEDEKAATAMRLLEQTMLMEEYTLLGGNASISLGTTPTPTATAPALTGATLPTATYSVIAVAMTYEGYYNAGGGTATTLVQSKTVTGQDAGTYAQNGGYAQKSAAASQAVTLGQSLNVQVTAVTGALAYAWYVGAAGSEKLERITTTNTAVFSAPLAGTGQLASALTASDVSNNSASEYDGFFSAAFVGGSGAYVKSLASATGAATTLTASGRGSVVEIDNALKAMWDNYQLSPSVMFVNSQQLYDIATKVYGNTSYPLLSYFGEAKPGSPAIATGGTAVISYLNPFTANNQRKLIDIQLHPAVPAGTILLYAEELPTQYKSASTPHIAAVRCRRDYYQLDFPQVRRAYEMGVYSEQAFIPYFPAGIGVITNILPG